MRSAPDAYAAKPNSPFAHSGTVRHSSPRVRNTRRMNAPKSSVPRYQFHIGEAGQEPQAGDAVEVGEQPHRAGVKEFEVGAELVGQPDPVGEQVLPGSHHQAEHDRGRGVGDQRTETGAVGAQGVGEDEGVEPVVLVPGSAVAAAQAVDLVGADHHDRHAGAQECVDNLSVAAFDGHLPDAGAVESGARARAARTGRVDGELLGDGAFAVHDGDGVVGGGPVQTSGDVTGRGLRQSWRGCSCGVRHVDLR